MKEPKTPASDAERVKALESLNILDTEAEIAFDDITLLASQICDTPIALVSLVDKDRQWFKSKIGLTASETDRSISFCGHAINEPQNLFMVPDAKEDKRFFDNPLVTGSPNIRFYAGMPLLNTDGHALGTLCVIDEKPKILTQAQQNSLKALARLVDSQIELRKKYDYSDLLYKRIESILENTQDMIYEVGANGIFSYANRTMSEVTGYGLDEISSMKFTELIHEDDKSRVRDHYINAVKKQVSSSQIDFKIRTKLSETRSVSQSVKFQYKPDGSLVSSIGVVRDMTDLLKEQSAHEHTKTLLEKTSDVARIGTWEVNLETGNPIWSEMTRNIHEVDSDYEPILEEGINFYKEGYSRNKITEVFGKAVSEGVHFDVELEIVTAKGNERWIRSIGIPHMKDGKCVRIYGTFQDIDDRKRNEKSIEDLLNKSSEQNKRLQDFAHIASHNLRSHSGNISTLLNFFRKDHPELLEGELFKMMQSASDSLHSTVRNLTDITLPNSNSVELLVPLNLNEALMRAKDNLAGLIDQANIELISDIPKQQMILGIPAYIDSIFNNLISNSIKFRKPEGNCKISIESTPNEAFLEVKFSDNGLGMDMDKTRDRVFGLNQTFHNNKDSKGIGLYITKNHIDSMGGTIQVDSEIGKGTTFTFTLNLPVRRN